MPINYTYGFDYIGRSDSNFGIEMSLNVDLSLGYRALMFWMVRSEENILVLNPNLFVEIASHSWFKISFGIIDVKIALDLIGYKFSPVDYQATWSLDNYDQYCHSISYT